MSSTIIKSHEINITLGNYKLFIINHFYKCENTHIHTHIVKNKQHKIIKNKFKSNHSRTNMLSHV